MVHGAACWKALEIGSDEQQKSVWNAERYLYYQICIFVYTKNKSYGSVNYRK
jgi:hypothetical protein